MCKYKYYVDIINKKQKGYKLSINNIIPPDRFVGLHAHSHAIKMQKSGSSFQQLILCLIF